MIIEYDYKKCIVCLDRPPGDPEHIIPQMLGGRLAAYMLCDQCNHRFGSQLVSSLKTDISIRLAVEGVKDVVPDFASQFLERSEYIDALMSIQTGSIAGDDVFKSYSEDEIQGDVKEKLLPNVRLVNGTTKQETRQKLMLTFNTPFYPDTLVASSVMAEGVDLHLNCRYIIHHDLCWNPSTLEQRTGRVDRIGAKVEKCGSPINISFLIFPKHRMRKCTRL